MLTKRLLICSR